MPSNWASYPPPPNRWEVPTVHPRLLGKLQAPPPEQLMNRLQLAGTLLSATSQITPFTPLFSRTRHIIPAAFPRMYSSALTEKDYPQPAPIKTNQERKQRAAHLGTALLEKRRAVERGEISPNPQESPVLLMEVERLVRVDDHDEALPGSKGDGLTLVFAHANGFHKEMWDVIIKYMETHEDSPRIQEVWSFDAVNQGNSASLNHGLLGDIFDWTDNARDFINLVAAYLPSRPGSADTILPVILPRVPEWEIQRRLSIGFVGRTVVGIGHSMGAVALSRAAAEFGSLWSSIILIDPAFVPGVDPDPTGGVEGLVNGALSRRSTWNSRAEALKLFQSNPFFAAFDPEILSIYVDHGLMDDIETGGVRLKTTGFQEAVTFTERRSVYEAWELLSQIDVHIPIHWMLSGRKPKVTGNEEVTAQTAWRRWQNASNVRVPGAGHLITQEAPKLLAEGICEFLRKTYGIAEQIRFPHVLSRAQL